MAAHGLDFLVIGVPRAGSTSLHEYMRTHPELVLPAAKEQHFFTRDAAFDEGWEAFEAVAFHGEPAGGVRGLVVPQCLGGPVSWGERTIREAAGTEAHLITADRIRAGFPEIKLVAILRDPVERAVSGYWYVVALGEEPRGLNEALAEELRPEALERSRAVPANTNQYVVIGEYGRLIDGYLRYFPRQSLFVGSTDAMGRDPAGLLEDLWRFLGVDPGHRPPNRGARYNVRGTGAPPHRVASWLNRRPSVRRAWRALPAPLRNPIRARWRRHAYHREQRSRVEPETLSEELAPELRARLERHYADDLRRLEELVGPVEGVTPG